MTPINRPALILTALLTCLPSMASSNGQGVIASGGGWIPGVAGGRTTFTFSVVHNGDGTFGGHLLYRDRDIGFVLLNATIESAIPAGCSVTFSGIANAGETQFEVSVVDNGEAGSGTDILVISATGPTVPGGVYVYAQLVGGGNIRVAGQECP